jgi:ATP-dependent DNA ligase
MSVNQELKKFPTLFKVTKTGAIQQWTIWADGNKVYTEFGKQGGKLTVSAPTVIAEGKNIGKTNETTPEQQALAEAEAEWTKKSKNGYATSVEKAGVDEAGGYWPMLAKKFSEDADKIVFPCYGQKKYDGHRCGCVVKGGKVTLWSRKREPVKSVPHIIKALEDLKLKLDINLDGELFVGGVAFEDLAHLIRSSTPRDGHEVLEYHVYDIAAEGMTMTQRLGLLNALKADLPEGSPIKVAETVWIENEAAAMAYFRKCRDEGYEGCMLRNADGLYLSHPTGRSNDLQKIKEMDDAEFVIIDINPGNGKFKDCAVFTVLMENGKPCDVSMKGDLASRKKYLTDKKAYIGKKLTVQYQGVTKYGKLRFPIALRLFEPL